VKNPKKTQGKGAAPPKKERRKPVAERKEEQIRIRVTEEQKKILSDAAAKEGLDVSGWLRSLGLKAAAATSSS
jgi:uncharacterized protein (DUF1778 family)